MAVIIELARGIDVAMSMCMKYLILILVALIPSVSIAAKKEITLETVLTNAKCGAAELDVIERLGGSHIRFECVSDPLYTASRYGQFWIIYKGGAAFAIQHHSTHEGPCIGQKMARGIVTAYWICD